ncbi:winged helix-turn-helix domain-containing protein [Thalassomonas actiniarum]|uniref:PD40 domain-containing protein n=1 Tax=Thalassomonas actiniarum TaxID=485447 RepID=A0AAE9YQY8_9GAMM|nr:winged helix-turn-helix domain-containing protein [Thalassomonas actiniarum]WDD99590.1 PD40 domain-containing protein [Thalassomonas actiniarum]
MENNTAATVASFTVGDFTVHGSRNLITRGETETAITPKMLAVLTELASHQGTTLSKEHLIIAVWGTPHTSDMVLSRAISDLRKVFGDSARQQAYIETVTKQGYRLKQAVNWLPGAASALLPVNETQAPEQVPLSEQSPEAETKGSGVNAKKVWLVFSVLALAVLLLGTWLFQDKESNADVAVKEAGKLSEPTFTYLTRDQAYERYLRFSVDGKMLAYSVSSQAYAGGRIVLRSLTDNKLITLGAASVAEENIAISYDVAPAFSPDGKEIAYKHFTGSGCLIRVYHLLDASERDLAPCPYAQTQALDWSPDGKQLVTTVFNQIKKIEGLALVDAQSGNTDILPLPQQPASGYLWPRFSPNGKVIAVVYYQPNSHLWTLALVDKASGAYTEILATGEEVSQVLWDEAGDALYYLLVNSSNDGIWKVNLSSKETTFIAGTKSNSLDFDEASGQFAGITREQKVNIWQSSPDPQGNRVVKPLFKNLPQTSYPRLSADNKMLAFVSTTSDIDSLWLRSLGDNYNRLVFQAKAKEKLVAPAWSPDGKQLLISVLGQDSSRIIQFDLELGNADSFAGENNVKMGQWSQDGAMFYWYEEVDGIWQVMAKELASGQTQSLLQHPVSRFAIPDKKHLHYQKIGTVKVHSRTLAGDESQTPADKMLLSLKGSYEWDAHADVIYYMSPGLSAEPASKAQQMLFKMELATGQSETLYEIDPVMAVDSDRHLSVSSDGTMAFYTKLDKYHTDVVLISR